MDHAKLAIMIRLGAIVNSVLIPTNLCYYYCPLQQLVVKSDGEFYVVRERPEVHKLGICLHQYDCRYGENCKFAHGQAELKLWKGACDSLHVWALLLALLVCTSLCTYIQVHVGTPPV